MQYGLSNAVVGKIQNVFAAHPQVKQAILYGSRALGTHRAGSDIDITLTGAKLNFESLHAIHGKLDDLNLPNTFDLSIYRQIKNADLRNHIERVGVVMYAADAAAAHEQYPQTFVKGGWSARTLGELCSIKMGRTPARKNPELWDAKKATDNVWLSIADLPKTINAQVTKSKEHISDLAASKCEAVLAGTLLVSFKLTLGRLAFAGRDLFTNEAIAALTILDEKKVTKHYLYWYLKYFDWDKAAEGDVKVKGKTFNKAKLQVLPVILPPLAEQKRIVAALDKAFAEIAAAVANAEKSVAKVRELFESEMHYAFRGKPANCGKKKSTEYLLEQVAAISAGNSAPQDKTLFEDGKHPFVRTADVGKIRFGTVDSTADYLNDKGVAKLRRFPRGTILFPKSGASTFLNHRVMMGFDGYVSSHLATIVPDAKKVDPQFLLYFLHTVKAQDLVQDHGYPSLNLPLIKAIRICLPPMSEQKRIAGKLGKVTTATKSLVALSRRKSGALADLEKSILWQTFSGEAR